VATSIATVSMRLNPGGLRELHWHAFAAEWAYVVKGNVRTTVITPNSNSNSNPLCAITSKAHEMVGRASRRAAFPPPAAQQKRLD